MKKLIVSIIVSITMLIQLSIIVSADYVDMLDYGMLYKKNSYYYDVNGAGSTITGNRFVWYWALDSFNTDYTYTFTFRFSSTERIPDTVSTFVYLTRNKFNHNTDTTTNVPVYSDLSYDSTTGNYTSIVKINFGLVGWTDFPVYVSMRLNNNSEITTTINGWGVSAEYDPGGSKYIEEYLNQIVNAGSGYPVPDGTNLDNSLNNLNNSEDVVKNKSNELMNKVNSEMSQNITEAKELSTKLKPAALQINNIYNSFMSVLPTEVKAIFIAIPLLLFVGWLVGRIRE